MSRRAATFDVFHAIADPTRRSLLDLLLTEEQPVGTLAERFSMTLSAISQHLRVLREAGLVLDRREGRERYYRVNAAPLLDVADWLQHYEHFWNDRLDALGRHLSENE
jgi:DNA-binding transcriptional ArsR family regulator